MMRPVSRLKFLIERQFVKGPLYQLMFIVICVGLISLVGGIVVLGTVPGETGVDAIWWAFLRLTDPGYLGDDEGIWRRIVSTALTVAGYVLFMGSLVAILTQWLIRWMRELERGLTPVAFKHHFVILGWTNRTIPILRELILSQGRVQRFFAGRKAGKRLRMVLLVEDLNPHIYHELTNDVVAGRYQHQITARSGSALHNDHLARVACLQASAIVLPAVTFSRDPSITSDIETIKILLSLDRQAERVGARQPFVVAEIQDYRKLVLAREVYSGQLELIAGDLSISRLIAQTVRHPGLSQVYLELLSHDYGNNFYLIDEAPHIGRNVAELMAELPNAIVCGVVQSRDGKRKVSLNLPANGVIAPGDKLILISRSFKGAHHTGIHSPVAAKVLDTQVSLPSDSERSSSGRDESAKTVLVLGWSRKVPALLKEFAAYGEGVFRLTVVSTRSMLEREQILVDQGVILPEEMCLHLEADFTVEHQLKRIRPETYDSIIITSSERMGTGAQADARSLVAWLLLGAYLKARKAHPQIVMELSDSHNEQLIDGQAGEILITPLIVSHLLAQVALQRDLAVVFDALFGAGGADIDFCRVHAIGLPLGRHTFAQIQWAAMKKGMTALGVYPDLYAEGVQGRVVLNPARNAIFDLTETEGIVVLASTGRDAVC
jgi:hypothetical protein